MGPCCMSLIWPPRNARLLSRPADATSALAVNLEEYRAVELRTAAAYTKAGELS